MALNVCYDEDTVEENSKNPFRSVKLRGELKMKSKVLANKPKTSSGVGLCVRACVL